MKTSATNRFGTEQRKKNRRISILNNDRDRALTLPTPQNRLFEGRWV
jgi:hypothetical protein